MSDSWRQTMMNITDRIFPSLPPEEKIGPAFGNEIVSSLPLQMSLYFNIVYFPFWLYTFLSLISFKLGCLSMLIQTIICVSLFLIMILECARLYLGVQGNLNEKIPDLAAFWMFSLILQLPLHSFLGSLFYVTWQNITSSVSMYRNFIAASTVKLNKPKIYDLLLYYPCKNIILNHSNVS
ncbi:transmembrane protein 17-like isoform X2 [Rhopalosiphum maidis]|uniref:transmembrane protein 17-like isoform X2 n=1 Tax=Rhopalosiphum maidis TaxID=43146 RepID=UPI000EFF2F6D|nr:transmembrane protein 17-like isoform X2 [Rhopalosiphum maidis]